MKATSRKNDPAGMRGRIVEAAYRIFTRSGYNSTGMQQVRAAALVSGGAFAHHFATKRSLALAVIETKVAEAVDAAWCAPMREASSAADGVRDAFDKIISELRGKNSISGCPLNNLAVELSAADNELRAASDIIFERWTNTIAAKIANDPSGPRDGSAFDTAMLVVAGYSGAMAMAKVSQSVRPLEVCRDELVKLLTARGQEISRE